MNPEIEQKTDRLREVLAALDLDAVLLNAQHNFAWLSGGGANGVDFSRDNGVASLAVDRTGRRYLVANNIELQRMLDEQVSADEFEPIEFPWPAGLSAGTPVVDLIRKVVGGDRIGVDLPFGSNVPVIESSIAPCRYSLTAQEVERYRALGHDAGTALRTVIDLISPGQTELEIAETLRHELARSGMNSVVTLVAADDRIKRYRHPLPTENRWEKVLMLVTCARRQGLIANLTRMVSVGPPGDDLTRRTEAAAYVNARLMHSTKVGASGADLFGVAISAYAEKGYVDEVNLHHQGGATGYRTREWLAHPGNAEVVRSCQAFAWNPSITGTKIEETCILGDDGVEMLTASPDYPAIATTIDGREYQSPGIYIK